MRQLTIDTDGIYRAALAMAAFGDTLRAFWESMSPEERDEWGRLEAQERILGARTR